MNNLGIALGAYTNEMNRQREQRRADAADQRQQQQFDLQMQEAERAKGIRSQRESEIQRLQQIRGALANPNDPANWTVLQQAAKDYGVGNIERMGNSVGVFAGGEQGVPQFKPLDLGAYSKIARERLAMLEPESAMAYMDSADARAYDEGWKNKTFGLEQRKLDITRDSDAWKRDAAMRGLDIDELKARAYARCIAAQSGGGGRSSRPEMREVTWMGQDGKPRTGLVAFAQEGGRLRAYDPATGQELPVQDPRFRAVLEGAPKNSRPGAMGYEALGSSGFIQDKATGALFRQDEEGNLVPAQTGSSFENLLQKFGSALRPQDGLPSIKPAEGFEPRSGLNVTRPSAQVEYVRNPVTGQLITRDEYNRLTGEGGSWWGNLFGGR